MAETDFAIRTETQHDVLESASAALALHIFAHHALRGLVNLNGVLEDENIPLVIRRFLDLEIRFSITRSMQPLRSSFYLKPELEEPAIQTLTSGLIMSGQVPSSQFRSYLLNALAITHEYLIHPQSTLVSLLTAGEADAQIDSRFFEILNHAGAYGHLPEIAKAWAERQKAEGIDSVTEADLASLFGRIDRSVLSNYQLVEIAAVIDPLFEFYWIGAIDQITASTLEEFFDDRGMTKARNAIADSSNAHFSRQALVNFLAVLLGEPVPVSSAEIEQARSTNQDSPIKQPLKEESFETANEADYEEFIHELRSAGVAILPSGRSGIKTTIGTEREVEPVAEARTVKSATAARELVETGKIETATGNSGSKDTAKFILDTTPTLNVPLQVGAYPLLQKHISAKDRKKFIEKLFHDNATDYERFVALINQSENWKQASVYVDAIFLRHKINPYSKQAVRFTDIVYSCFLKRT